MQFVFNNIYTFTIRVIIISISDIYAWKWNIDMQLQMKNKSANNASIYSSTYLYVHSTFYLHGILIGSLIIESHLK